MKRLISTSSILQTPRKFRLPTKYNAVSFPDGWDKTPRFKRVVQPRLPKPEDLVKPVVAMNDYLRSLPVRKHLKAVAPPVKQGIRFAPRYPLPLTFKPGQDFKSWLEEKKKPQEPLTNDANFYPFKYYQVTMIRGLIGLPKKTRKIALSLGLRVVNQQIFISVSPANAGKLLKLKELIRVELVNEIPPLIETVDGFTKIGNIMGKSLSQIKCV